MPIKILIKHFFSFILHLLYIFPVKKNKLYFRSFSGASYSCNPKYLYEWIRDNCSVKYKCVWQIDKGLKIDNSIIVTNFISLKSFYHAMTSKYIVTNTGFPWWIPLRKSQVMLETWHGGGAYKRVGAYENNGKWFQYEQIKDAENIDFYISSSEKFTEVQSESKYVEKAKFINTGMPRNSIFFNSGIVENNNLKVRDFYKIDKNKKIVLYAPTYRGKTGFKTEGNVNIELDFNAVLESLKKKFTSEWILFYRSHYFDSSLKVTLKNKIIDATKYEDMQELLCAADVLITDYSSSMWDYALLKRPCFFYAPDIKEYINNRGFYTDPKTWPGLLAESNEDLTKKIECYDEKSYIQIVETHFNSLNSYECEDSCKKICEIIGIE